MKEEEKRHTPAGKKWLAMEESERWGRITGVMDKICAAAYGVVRRPAFLVNSTDFELLRKRIPSQFGDEAGKYQDVPVFPHSKAPLANAVLDEFRVISVLRRMLDAWDEEGEFQSVLAVAKEIAEKGQIQSFTTDDMRARGLGVGRVNGKRLEL